jgi:hypothetical protein
VVASAERARSAATLDALCGGRRKMVIIGVLMFLDTVMSSFSRGTPRTALDADEMPDEWKVFRVSCLRDQGHARCKGSSS